MNIKLNKKLLNLFKKIFKNDLLYFNNGGLIHYICDNFDPLLLNNNQIINYIIKNNLSLNEYFYIKDFKRYLNNNIEKSSLTINKLKYEDNNKINKAINLLNNNNLYYMNEVINKNYNKNIESEEYNESDLSISNYIYKSTIINYMMFYILVKNGFIYINSFKNINDELYSFKKEEIINDNEENKIYLE